MPQLQVTVFIPEICQYKSTVMWILQRRWSLVVPQDFSTIKTIPSNNHSQIDCYELIKPAKNLHSSSPFTGLIILFTSTIHMPLHHIVKKILHFDIHVLSSQQLQAKVHHQSSKPSKQLKITHTRFILFNGTISCINRLSTNAAVYCWPPYTQLAHALILKLWVCRMNSTYL